MGGERPFIAVTASSNYAATDGKEPRELRLTADYLKVVAAAGAVPLIACEECAEEFASMCGGLILTGGPDVEPELYGERKLSDSVKTDPARDRYEARLLSAFLEQGKPVFGICRGFQFLNVYFGGTLVQDLEQEDGWSHRDRAVRHPIRTEPDSILRRLFGEEFLVNTIHHQAVKKPGAGLRLTAFSPGGTAEAMEHERLPVFGVQFHPEKLAGELREEGLPEFQEIFSYFIGLVRQQEGK